MVVRNVQWRIQYRSPSSQPLVSVSTSRARITNVTVVQSIHLLLLRYTGIYEVLMRIANFAAGLCISKTGQLPRQRSYYLVACTDHTTKLLAERFWSTIGKLI